MTGRLVRLAVALVVGLAASACSTDLGLDELLGADEEPVVPVEPPPLDDLPGRLAVVTADGSLVTMDPDGTDLAVLDAGTGGGATQPTWSPTGELAWTSVTGDDPSVTVAGADGARRRVPAPAPPFYFAWSDDGSALATLAAGPDGIDASLVTTSSVELLGRGSPFYLSWGPDGRLATHVGGASVALLDPATGQVTDLGARSATYQAPAWASGGIVAVDSGLERNDLVLVDPDTAELTRLATFEGSVSFVVAPDRTRLAALVLPPAPAGGATEVPIRSVQPELTPLVPGELVVLDLTTGAITPVTADPVVAFSWGPTGGRLAYLRLTAGGPQWVYWNETQVLQSVPYVPSARTTEAYLPFFAQYAQSLSWWSPDGRAYAFAGQVGDEEGVWVDRLDDTGGPFLVAPGTHVAWSR